MEDKKKRKVSFDPNIEVDQTNKKTKTTPNNTRLHSGKYTLDSDEEDDEEQANNKEMNKDELDG
jgi:hypothetical protein